MISHVELKHLLHYDPETGIWTWINPLARHIRVGAKAGSDDGKGYTRIQVRGYSYRSGRLAWFYMTGEWPEDQIDHINRNTDDDRWINLREANQSQNNFNRGSGIRGVYRSGSKWRAQVGPNNDLGLFLTFEEAVAARDIVAARLGGEFAILNSDLTDA